MTLGQKIRALRKERKMTQSTLAGSEITRNMLSRIESDSALPSLPTLLYLAKQLNVPAGYLLSENLSLFTCQKEEFLPALKHWYSLGNYKEVLRLYRRDFDGTDDEVAYLVAVSATECAKDAIHRGTMKTASEHLTLAKEMAEKTVYADKRLRAVIVLLEALLGNVQMPRFALSASEYTSFSTDSTWEDLYRYLTDDMSEYAFHDPLIKEHVEAKKLLLAGKHKDALAALTAIESKRSTPGFSVLVLFRLYADIEACYKEMFNYEEAYRYASKRLALLSAFRA
jgi:transcriptional regulator with XRE-family HTH domain